MANIDAEIGDFLAQVRVVMVEASGKGVDGDRVNKEEDQEGDTSLTARAWDAEARGGLKSRVPNQKHHMLVSNQKDNEGSCTSQSLSQNDYGLHMKL